MKLMLTDKYLLHENKTDHIWEIYFPDFRSELDPNPDQIFHETDPRIQIRIHNKMKRIRNTG